MDADAGYTVCEYCYRDGGNFKTYGRLLLSGQNDEAEGIIRKCLEWGDQFVAEQIGVPSLCHEHWKSVGDGPSDLDHAFHEFVCFRTQEGAEASLPVWGSVEELVSRMRASARRWDVRLSPNCHL